MPVFRIVDHALPTLQLVVVDWWCVVPVSGL
jgi:hypothetical protein